MGGLFSPDPPSPPPPPPAAPAAPDPNAEAEKQRLEAIGRNRRGLYGTIATSDRGVLEPANANANATAMGKSLLGE